MTSAFSVRRRADEFEALLSRGLDSPLSDREAAQFAALLAVVADLRAVPQVTPRAEFVSSLRESLMAEADTVLLRQPAAPQRLAMPATTRPRDRRVATLLGGAALIGATATMAVAAQTSLPGESLYGVKRGIESAQVRLAGDDAARGRTLLAQAGTRLTELEELSAGDGTEQLIPDTLDTFTEQSGEGVRSLLTAYSASGSDADVQAAREFTSTSMERLEALQRRAAGERPRRAPRGRAHADRPRHRDQHGVRPLSRRARPPPPTSCSAARRPTCSPGLDSDELTLEAAPVSGQDVAGITDPRRRSSHPSPCCPSRR